MRVYDLEMRCGKCGFPMVQMYRELHSKSHKRVIDGDIKMCNIKGEHLHIECCCGQEFTLRPLDWNGNVKPKARKNTNKK